MKHLCCFPANAGKVFIKLLLSWDCLPITVQCYTDYFAVACSDICTAVQHCGWNSFLINFLQQPPVGHGLLIHEVSRSHNDAPQSVVLLRTSDQFVAETSTWQHNTHNRHPSPRGIRTHNLSRRAAADLRLRPRGHWDRPIIGASINKIHNLLHETSFVRYFTKLVCSIWSQSKAAA